MPQEWVIREIGESLGLSAVEIPYTEVLFKKVSVVDLNNPSFHCCQHRYSNLCQSKTNPVQQTAPQIHFSMITAAISELTLSRCITKFKFQSYR